MLDPLYASDRLTQGGEGDKKAKRLLKKERKKQAANDSLGPFLFADCKILFLKFAAVINVPMTTKILNLLTYTVHMFQGEL